MSVNPSILADRVAHLRISIASYRQTLRLQLIGISKECGFALDAEYPELSVLFAKVEAAERTRDHLTNARITLEEVLRLQAENSAPPLATEADVGRGAGEPAPAPKPAKKPALLWNQRGQVGCELPGHAPHKGSDSWRFEKWSKVPKRVVGGLERGCEVCEANARRAAAIAKGGVA